MVCGVGSAAVIYIILHITVKKEHPVGCSFSHR